MALARKILLFDEAAGNGELPMRPCGCQGIEPFPVPVGSPRLFTDNFDRPDEPLSDSPNWPVTPYHHQTLYVDGEEVQNHPDAGWLNGNMLSNPAANIYNQSMRAKLTLTSWHTDAYFWIIARDNFWTWGGTPTAWGGLFMRFHHCNIGGHSANVSCGSGYVYEDGSPLKPYFSPPDAGIICAGTSWPVASWLIDIQLDAWQCREPDDSISQWGACFIDDELVCCGQIHEGNEGLETAHGTEAGICVTDEAGRGRIDDVKWWWREPEI